MSFGSKILLMPLPGAIMGVFRHKYTKVSKRY